jgi:dTDP-glucose 4,6-dehydratase
LAENLRFITGDVAGTASHNQPVLVTGGAGFIGSHFVRHLLNTTDCAVLNLDLLTYAGNLDSLADLQNNPRHQLVQGDIGDLDLVGRLLRHHQPQAVVNLAAESHVDRSIDTPDDFIQTNVVATGNLLKACLSYWETLPVDTQDGFRFLHVSTDEVYGSLGATGMFTEQTRYAPNSPYAASKAASDHLVRAYHHTYGLPTMVSISSNNFGPAQFPEKLIPLMILNAQGGLRLPVYGDGTHVRDWLYVVDHCEALWTILQEAKPGETYNIGANSEKTNLEIVETICDTVDELLPGLAHAPSRSLIEFVTDRPGHDHRYAIDATKLKSELGWHARTSFAEGIRRTVVWYLENSAWVAGAMTKGYHRQRLGLPTATSNTAGSRDLPPTTPAPE